MATLDDLISGDAATLRERTDAYRKALQGDRALGLIAAMSGDKTMGGVGKHLLTQYGQDVEGLAKVPMQRQAIDSQAMQMRLHQEQLDRVAAQNAARRDPATARVLRQTLSQYGVPDLDPATPVETLESLVPTAEKAFAAKQAAARAQEALQDRKDARDRLEISHVVDPITGAVTFYDKRGRPVSPPAGFTQPGSPGTPPAGAPGAAGAPQAPGSRPGASAAGPAKMQESQGMSARRAGEGSISMTNALAAGFPNPGLTPNAVGEVVGGRLSKAGLPMLATEGVEQRTAFWGNVADPIMRARTGAAMPTKELEEMTQQLSPRAGESPDTQMKKAMQLVQFFKNQTVGLPPQVSGPLLEQLDEIERGLPKDEKSYNALTRSHSGGSKSKKALPNASAAAVEQRATSYMK